MSVTAYNFNRSGNLVTVTVTSDLTGVVYYHWYRDGVYVGTTMNPAKGFYVPFNEQARVQCNDTTSAAYDPIANAPTAFSANRTLYWTRSLSSDVAFYRIEYQVVAPYTDEDKTLIARIPVVAGQWDYHYLTPQIAEVTGLPLTVEFSISPEDVAGNIGTATVVTDKIVRRPAAPDFTLSFDEGTTYVTIAEAA